MCRTAKRAAAPDAVALGHDIGHTPFGHVGERTLNLISNNCEGLHPYFNRLPREKKGFKHNLHGLRVACHLEKAYRSAAGMNLTNFTLWGIKTHSRPSWDRYDSETGKLKPCEFNNEGQCFFQLKPRKCMNERLTVGFYDQYAVYTKTKHSMQEAWCFEGFVVANADEIAQRHHDVEDGIIMKVISINELKEIIQRMFKKHFDKEDRAIFSKLNREKNEAYFIPLVSRFIVNLLNKNLIENSKKNLNDFIKKYSLKNEGDFLNSYCEISFEDAKKCISFDDDFEFANNAFQDFLKNRILNSFEVQRMDGRGTYIIRKLLKAYLTNPKQLSNATLVAIENIHRGRTTGRKIVQDYSEAEIGNLRNEIDSLSKKSSHAFQMHLLRGICDHIAGMTDNFAISEYKRLYGLEPVLN